MYVLLFVKKLTHLHFANCRRIMRQIAKTITVATLTKAVEKMVLIAFFLLHLSVFFAYFSMPRRRYGASGGRMEIALRHPAAGNANFPGSSTLPAFRRSTAPPMGGRRKAMGVPL